MKKKRVHENTVDKKKPLRDDEGVHEFVEKKLSSEDHAVAPISIDTKKTVRKKLKKKKVEKKNTTDHPVEEIANENDAIPVSEEKEARIMKQLTEIYENPDGSMPDMAAFKSRRHSGLVRALITLIVLGVLTVFGTYAYSMFLAPNSEFFEEDVLFTVQADESVNVGQEVHYRIRVKNAQKATLQKAKVEIHYPTGFIFEEATLPPVASTTNVWEIGTVAENEGESIDIRGRLYGNAGEEQSLRAFLRYQPSNFSSEFQKTANVTTVVTKPPFSLLLEMPKELAAGATGELVMSLEPEEAGVLEHLRLEVDAGQEFIKKESTPESSETGPLSWNIDELTAGIDIVIRGVFSDVVADTEQTVRVRVLGWPSSERSGNGYVYAEETKTLHIKKTDLSAELIVNGSQGTVSLQPGEKVNASLTIKNTGSVTLSNIEAALTFEAPADGRNSIFDWNNLVDDADGSIVGTPMEEGMRRGTITWKSGQVNALKSFKPGDDAVIDVVLPVKGGEQTDLTAFEKSNGQAFLEITYGKDGEKKHFASAPIKLIFNSDIALEVQDEMEEKDGKEVHRITWLLSNTFHELKDVQLTAELFGDVSLDEDNITAPAGNVVYNKEEKKLTWKIDTMPLTVDVLALQFPVVIQKKNPTQKNLTSKVEITAIDTVTGEKIVEIGDEVLLLAQ